MKVHERVVTVLLVSCGLRYSNSRGVWLVVPTGGLQVYPPPTTPPEPAPPDRECVEGPPRRLVKATTLPTPTLHSATSRTSLDDLTCNVHYSALSTNYLFILYVGVQPNSTQHWNYSGSAVSPQILVRLLKCSK